MKKRYLKIAVAGMLASVFFASPAFANCKTQADSAERAQDARNAACNSAGKSLKDKSLEEIKKGDKVCKKKEEAYKKAKKYLKQCTDKL